MAAAAILNFVEVKFDVRESRGWLVSISVPNLEAVGFSLWAKFCLNMCNSAWVMAINVNFQNGSSRHLEFCRSEIWHQAKSRLARIYLHTKFGEVILKGGRVMTIYVFLKWRSATILDFQRSEIWRHFCFEDVGFSLWAKLCVNMCNSAWVMAINVNFKMAAAAILDFVNRFLRPPTTANWWS